MLYVVCQTGEFNIFIGKYTEAMCSHCVVEKGAVDIQYKYIGLHYLAQTFICPSILKIFILVVLYTTCNEKTRVLAFIVRNLRDIRV